MNKILLLEKYIKVAVKKAIKEQEDLEKKAEKSMYLIYRFPGLKKAVEDLMSPAFGRYIASAEVIAPKPTTFKFKLINGQDFSIYYLKKNKWMAKIAGKKYYLENLEEIERGSQAIANLLDLNYSNESKEDQQNKKDADLQADFGKSTGGGGGSSSSTSTPSGGPVEEEPPPGEEENTPPEGGPVPKPGKPVGEEEPPPDEEEPEEEPEA